MKINGIVLNNFQSNFLKELMGDVFMTDVRAEGLLNRTCIKYDVDAPALLEVVNKNHAAKNAEFKKLQVEDSSL